MVKYRNTLKRIMKWPGGSGYKWKMIYNVSLVYRITPDDKERKKELLEMWDKAFEDIDALAKANPPPITKKDREG